jgi:hypothetical protein
VRLLKVIGLALVALLVLNVLTWGLVGRGSALSLAPRFFDRFGPYDDLDTLHVFDGYGAEWDDSLSTPGDFSPRQREAFLSGLREVSSVPTLLYHDEVGEPFAEDTVNFGVWINRRYPLAAHVTSAVSTLGYAATYDRWYVWAFGWRPIGRVGMSES